VCKPIIGVAFAQKRPGKVANVEQERIQVGVNDVLLGSNDMSGCGQREAAFSHGTEHAFDASSVGDLRDAHGVKNPSAFHQLNVD
jgi:hypothetical protein